jgi:type I restriction enzyme S subunit
MTGASCIVNNRTIVNRWTDTPRCIANEGDVLLVCKGSGYGTIAVLSQKKAHIARQFMALRCLPTLNHKFNYYLASSVVSSIKTDARGLIVGITREAVLKQRVIVPSLPEQNRIGEFFTDLDRLITLHQRELVKLQNIKKALLEKMFV